MQNHVPGIIDSGAHPQQVLTNISQQRCVGSMLEKASEFDCDKDDMACLCDVKAFRHGIHDCAIQDCSYGDQVTVLTFGENFCSGGLEVLSGLRLSSAHARLNGRSPRECCGGEDETCQAESSISDSECDDIVSGPRLPVER